MVGIKAGLKRDGFINWKLTPSEPIARVLRVHVIDTETTLKNTGETESQESERKTECISKID